MDRFIAKSPSSQKIINTLRISAKLPVNILVVSEPGSGKMTLVKEVFEDLNFYKPQDIKNAEGLPSTVGIEKLQNAKNLSELMRTLAGHRVIALSDEMKSDYEDFFPVILNLPPLSERPEDLEELVKVYLSQAKKDLEIQADIELDLPEKINAIELKREIYKQLLFQTVSDEEFLEYIEAFLKKRLPASYKDLLSIFEVPLLRAAKKEYKSTLAMSKVLELNRATLTKKLQKYKDLLQDQR